jgi:Domain of unknown function (DUF4402)
MKILVGAATAVLLMASGSSALAAQASATVTANATVITPLTATASKTLEFGKLVMDSSGTGGTLVIAAATGGRTVTGGVNLVGGTSGHSAVFDVVGDTVNGSPNAYTVTIPSTATLTGPSSATMSVTGISTNTGGLTTLVGTNHISIGATLNASSGQAQGAYTGTFDVTSLKTARGAPASRADSCPIGQPGRRSDNDG